MPVRRTVLLVFLAALAGALLSGLLLLQHYNQAHDNALVSMMCGGDGKSGCEAVDESPYSSLLGIPLAAYGLFFYLLVALSAGLSLAGDEKTKQNVSAVIFMLASFAFLADVALLLVQALAIGAFCTICLSTYAATFLILVFSWKHRSFDPAGKLRALAASPAGGKMFLASWTVGIALLAAGVFASNLALSLIDPTTFDQRLADIAYGEFMESPSVALDVEGDPVIGPADAPIKIVLFSDFLCPWCKQVAENIQQNFLKWNDKVAVYYKSFPLDRFCNPVIGKTLHAGSCWLVLGGVCAQDQGKFWEYHDAAYAASPANPDGHDVLVLASSAGIDTVRMKQCMMQVANQGRVRKLIKDAGALGVKGTPVIYINGHRLPRIAYFSYVLRLEAERLGLPPLEGLDE